MGRLCRSRTHGLLRSLLGNLRLLTLRLRGSRCGRLLLGVVLRRDRRLRLRPRRSGTIGKLSRRDNSLLGCTRRWLRRLPSIAGLLRGDERHDGRQGAQQHCDPRHPHHDFSAYSHGHPRRHMMISWRFSDQKARAVLHTRAGSVQVLPEQISGSCARLHRRFRKLRKDDRHASTRE